jgi:hypothetical protein
MPAREENFMVKRLFLLLSIAGLYLYWIRRHEPPAAADDHAAEADWANEGGQNTSAAV